jgi:hypothetical protein
MKTVSFDKDKLELFKAKYEESKGRGANHVFKFESDEYLVSYAKYLIEYLEGEVGEKEN